MSDIKKELKETAAKINEYLRAETYPEFLRPEELRSAVRAYPMMGGKRLRPALLLWSCGLFGGNPEQALPAAAAVEIYHNWTLVHDDIIDCDDFRRGVPTTHSELARYAEAAFHAGSERAAKFGSDMAILAGDAQQGWANDMFLRLADNGVDPMLVIALSRRMQQTLHRELLSGEALDVEFPLHSLNDISEENVMKMLAGKTSALLRFSMEAGAAIALGKADFQSAELTAVGIYADNLGLAYQLQDDLLGVFGELAEFGKPICSDFKESKPTVLYLETKKRLSPEKQQELDSLMGLPFYNDEMVEKIRLLVSSSGAADMVRMQSWRLSQKALEQLHTLPDNHYREILSDLLGYLLDRNV